MNTVRWDNMVMYQTPSFSGFQFGVGYAFSVDDNAGADRVGFRTADNVRGITTGLRYVNGPLNIAFSYDQLNASNNQLQSAVDATPRSYGIGGSYDFEVVKLSLAYARTTDGWFGGQGINGISSANSLNTNIFADGFKANSYMVGLSAPIGGASKLFGSWQMVDPSNDRLNRGSGADETMNVFSLGYTYDLSKRTNCTPTVRTPRTTPSWTTSSRPPSRRYPPPLLIQSRVQALPGFKRANGLRPVRMKPPSGVFFFVPRAVFFVLFTQGCAECCKLAALSGKTRLFHLRNAVFHLLFGLQSSARSNRANATILRFAHLTDA